MIRIKWYVVGCHGSRSGGDSNAVTTRVLHVRRVALSEELTFSDSVATYPGKGKDEFYLSLRIFNVLLLSSYFLIHVISFFKKNYIYIF